PSSRDPIKGLWDRGLTILGKQRSARSLLGKLRKHYGDVVLLEAIAQTESECPSDPAAYLVGCCQVRKANERTHARAIDILDRAAIEFDERQDNRSNPEAADRSAR